MSPLLLLKILSPNQIHQLALMLLLLLSFMSVKPRKLDLLLGTPPPPLLLFHFVRALPCFSSIRKGFCVRFPLSVSLSASSSSLPLPGLNDFSPLCDLSFFSPSLSRCLSRFCSSVLLCFSGSLSPHCSSSPPPAPQLCPRSRWARHWWERLSLSVLTCAVLRPPLFVCCCCWATQPQSDERLLCACSAQKPRVESLVLWVNFFLSHSFKSGNRDFKFVWKNWIGIKWVMHSLPTLALVF